MGEHEFQQWTDVEILKILRKLEQCEYGLLLRFKNQEDMDYFRRKVYKLKKEHKFTWKPAMRLSPTAPKTELWLLRVTIESKRGEDGQTPTAEEVHNPTD